MTIGRKTGGRQKRTPNKVTRSLREMILAALDKSGGVDYLEDLARNEPAAFCSLLGKVLPLQVQGDNDKPLIIVTRAE